MSSPPSSTPPPGPSSFTAFDKFMQSLIHITVAGFGGTMAGLSLSRRGRFNTAVNISKNRSPFVDHDLPITWGMTCLTFAGIVEFLRLVQPTSVIMSLVSDIGSGGGGVIEEGPTMGDQRVTRDGTTTTTTREDVSTKAIGTVVDYTMGGTLAGAIFQGATIRTRTARIVAARAKGRTAAAAGPPIVKTGIMAGMIPGAVLGLMAGVGQYGIDYLERLAEEILKEETEEEGTMEEGEEKRLEREIEKEVKNLSTEEILKQIEELKKIRESGRAS